MAKGIEKNRKKYVKHYQELGKAMFLNCTIPTVGDFVKAYRENDTTSLEKIDEITKFTGNRKDIDNSVNRRKRNYSEDESTKFMESVIAANVTDITESGYFYKKLASSTDAMVIDIEDCGDKGSEFIMPVDEDTFNYRIRNHWVTELNKYIEEYKDLPKKGKIHVRSFLTCKRGPRCFCKKCAGLFRRSYQTEFVPKHIGIYSTLMITEHATQASLDSMNKGVSKKINKVLENTDADMLKIKTLADARTKINEIIENIGNVGVESRFYEVALLSRWRNNTFVNLRTSIHKQEDLFGSFIYAPNKTTLTRLLNGGTFEANSLKTMVAFDEY